MNIFIDDEDIGELRAVLDDVLRDLSYEIADTDNARFRAALRSRRSHLQRVRSQLERDGGRAAGT